MEPKEKDPTAPIQMTSASGDMYPLVPKEMPSFVETVSSVQEQAPPYPGPYFDQKQAPPYPGPYFDQQLAPPPQSQMIVVQSSAPPLGPRSVHLTCPACNAFIKTSITKNATGCAYIWCITLMCCICWLCSCIPLCMDSCSVFKHTCPKCKAYIGTYRP